MGEGGKLGSISQIIGGGLAFFAITAVYTDFINVPDIDFIHLNDMKGVYYIEFTNNGRISATNFILTVEAPVKLGNYQVFSTENWTEGTKYEHSLSIHFPRLAEGGGSLIKINIFLNETSRTGETGYIVYATYDQGSLRAISGRTPEVATPVGTMYGLPIVLSIFAIISFSIPYLYHRSMRAAARIHSKDTLKHIAQDNQSGIIGILVIIVPAILISWSVSSYVISGNPIQWIEKFENIHLIIAIIGMAFFGFFCWAVFTSAGWSRLSFYT